MYATLPTQVRIPFGFHLQADWFVNVDRQNLREVTGDAWQEAILAQVPEIVRRLLIWLSGESDAVRACGYRALCGPDDDGGLLAGPLRNLRDDLARTLADQPIVPVHGPGPRRFCSPERAGVLPVPFDTDFGSSWRPDLLFGPAVMDKHLLGERATEFAIWLEWGSEVEAGDVAWRDTLPNWWRALPEDVRPAALFALWRGVAQNAWHHVPVVPTKAGGWASAHHTWWLNEEPPAVEAVEAVAALPQFPDTTTGQQALYFLLDVWERKPASVEALRGHLAAAYRYVLDDLDAGDLPVGAWENARVQAHLYGHRGWRPIGPMLVVDDVQSPLIREFLPTDRIAVASAHLGDTKVQVLRVVQALEVALLSAEVEVKPGERETEPLWGSRLRQLTATLSQLEDRRPLHNVTLHDTLSLRVGGRHHAIQAYVAERDNRGPVLLLVGGPADFAVEAAEQLVEHFQLG